MLQIIENVEVTDESSLAAAAASISEPLDIVVINAGYFPDIHETMTDPENPLNFAEELKQIDICALGVYPLVGCHEDGPVHDYDLSGPLRCISELTKANKIKKPGGKVIIITSQVSYMQCLPRCMNVPTTRVHRRRNCA